MFQAAQEEKLALTLGSVTLQSFYMHKAIYNTIWDRKTKKQKAKIGLL